MVTFAEPMWLWGLLAPVVLLATIWWRHRLRLGGQRAVASPGVWRRVMGGAPSTGLARMLIWTVAAACAVLAAARPQWGELPGETPVVTRDLVVAVDVSASMRCTDMAPSRLERSVAVLQQSLPLLEGNRVGVVVFAGDAYPLVPLTIDLAAAGTFLASLSPDMVSLPGSNLERAVDTALELLPEEGVGRVVVVVSDGENLQGRVDVAAERLEELGVTAVGVLAGTEDGGLIPEADGGGFKNDSSGRPVVTRADRSSLQRLAEATGGGLVELADPSAVSDLVSLVADIRAREVDARQSVRRVERYRLFALAALVLVVVGFGLSPWRRLPAITAAVLIVAVSASLAEAAASAEDVPDDATSAQSPEVGEPEVPWWQRLVPGGYRRLARSGERQWRHQDHEAALRSFAAAAKLAPDDPERRFDLGTALGAAGDVEAATRELEAAADGGLEPSATYNLGTAGLMAEQPQVAVDALRRALLAAPGDPDVKRNYELALRLLEQQQQEQQQHDQNEGEDEREEDEESSEQQREQQQEQQPSGGAEPTPTPSAEPQSGQGGAAPTPTPDPSRAVYGALERADAEAREQMLRRTPQPAQVEKDW